MQGLLFQGFSTINMQSNNAQAFPLVEESWGILVTDRQASLLFP